MKKISSEDLINIIFENPKRMIEARLLINIIFSATHFIYYNGKCLNDEGIDGEKRNVSINEFLNNYRNNYWLIDNII